MSKCSTHYSHAFSLLYSSLPHELALTLLVSPLFKIPLSHSLRRRFNTYTLITSTFHAPIGRCITSARSTFIPHPSLLFKIAQHTLLVEKTPSTCNICEDSDTTPFYVSLIQTCVSRAFNLFPLYMCRSLGLRFSEENLGDFAMPALHLRLVGLLLWFSVAGLIVLPAEAQTCATRKFSNNKLFQHCSDLPTLSSSLHWTHDADGSLSIAFVAPPAKSDGWISWAINPTGSGMIGAQSLIAFKQTDGSMTVRPYRLNNYQSVEQKNLTLEVSDMSAESSGGQMMIFATFRLPANWTTVNQVWQVGSTVTDGRPIIHDTQTPNLNAKGTLDLVGGQTGTNTGGDSRIRKRNVSLHSLLSANLISFHFLDAFFPIFEKRF